MSQCGWANCPDDVRRQVEGLLAALHKILGSDLIGVYLHGSLAMGCFNPDRSDIDLTAFTTYITETLRRLTPWQGP